MAVSRSSEIMEGDEMEMTKEELQRWIREQVAGKRVISPDLLQKCKVLQSLLGKREKLSGRILKLSESVAACEDIVKKQYALLGWEYKDTDSDDGEKATSPGCTPLCPNESETHSPSASNSPLLPNPKVDKKKIPEQGTLKKTVKKELVVVLRRLSPSQIRAKTLCHSSDDKLLGDSDSDMQWEPEDGTGDSVDFETNSKPGPNKRRKKDYRNELTPKSVRAKAGPKTSTNTATTSTSTANRNPDADANTGTAMKTSTQPAGPTGQTGECKAPQSSARETPVVPQEEITVDMKVIARRKAMIWQEGTVLEKITKEDGRVKYKVCFEIKGKSLVSSHHIAFQRLPKASMLFVGARVVVKLHPDHAHFTPGILAEIPSRKNRMRFLVMCDNEIPIYVGLPFFHQVCQPLANPLDDIPVKSQKQFMAEYLEVWPYPPQTLYKVEQCVNVLYNGKQQKCEVLEVDCSLIRVVFQSDKHEEVLYRGSWRLEHMIKIRKELLQKREEQERRKMKTVDGKFN
ncbi:histone-lysine N-methyltransferase SETDB1-B-like [Parambassis ranga]|uniref:Histone-lysine N-methyltransferase SETDB1-B-like n=1 Tax=Parambassis ranga TaxID=210632 RepID=A0A6P7KI50_9TELE|nr:histone-lysine N-methyltransferase SETDB1-B-like [Parambassis ranga]